MASQHLFQLSRRPPDDQTDGGLRIRSHQKNFPVLRGMSLYKLILSPQGVREPHWHANADELGYCLKGGVLVSLYSSRDLKATFLVEEGDVFLIPSGALHAIENVGEVPAELILNFSSESPEDFELSSTFGMFSDSVLGNTWHVPQKVFQGLSRSLRSPFATLRKEAPVIPEEALYTTPFRYRLAKVPPLILNAGGSARVARQDCWPICKRQAVYSLELTGEGMREPHWHPETAELGYVEKGKGRMSILDPSGAVDTYEMEEGDIYFIPKAYPHHIENLSSSSLHLVIFFDQGMPGDIGLTGSVRSYSNELLGSVFQSPPSFFDQLHKYYADLFIVQKINPLD